MDDEQQGDIEVVTLEAGLDEIVSEAVRCNSWAQQALHRKAAVALRGMRMSALRDDWLGQC